MSINAHRAFDNSSGESYRTNLSPVDHEIDELRDARDSIRSCLKEAFLDWEQRISAKVLFEDAAVAALSARRGFPTLVPKFRGQGSYVYATLNQPTHNPPQEMDFDDGMFLPTSYVVDGRYKHPVIASIGYFTLVESALEPLCREKGWTLNPERKRPSCVRISLNNGRSHLDIALYAIPDDEYYTLVEKAATSSGSGADNELAFESVYKTISYDQIMLAHRDEGWKISDPRKLEDWFVSAVKAHGEQLRRVCRYLKGWRDNSWTTCRLSSIALMASVVRFFDDSDLDFVGRDDHALQAVAASLPAYLSNIIPNPVIDGRLDEGWDDPEDPCRQEFVDRAQSLRSALDAALSQSSRDIASAKLQEIFGVHFPSDASLLTEDGPSANVNAAAAASSAAVLGISVSEQAARAQSAAASQRSMGLASRPWGLDVG